MTYRIGSGDPEWTFDPTELERQVAAFAKANAITTQSGWTTFIASISTNAQAVAVCKGLLSAIKCGTP